MEPRQTEFGVVDRQMDRVWKGGNPVEFDGKTSGVMDCWPKGIGQMRKSKELDRKLMGIDRWVMVNKNRHTHV